MLDVSMKAAVQPIGNTCNVAMLHRIEMNIIDMPLPIGLIADRERMQIAMVSWTTLAYRSIDLSQAIDLIH